jgi:hypothetical protein
MMTTGNKPTNYRRQLLIELLADPTDSRTKGEKSLAAGFKCDREVFRQQRDPEFRAAVMDLMRSNIGSNLPAVFERLFRIARDGVDQHAIAACNLLLKASGEIAAATAMQVVNVTQTNATDEGSAESAIKRMWADRLVNPPDDDSAETDVPHRRTGHGRAFRIDMDEDD